MAKFLQLYKGETVSTIGSYAFKMLRKSADDGAGLYDADDNLIASWYDLTTTYGMDCETDYKSGDYNTITTNPCYVLNNNSDLSNGVKLIIGSNVSKIGESAFRYCTRLKGVTIPNSVTSIGTEAFFWCNGLRSITIPESVVSIGYQAFFWCDGLRSITIPESVVSIGTNAFQDCSGLTSIEIPESVTSIGDGAFSGCKGVTTVTVAEGNTVYHSENNCIIETGTNTLVSGCKNSIIPSYVTSIGNRIFYNCTGLTSITIPESVVSIGYGAFYNCSKLTQITIPNSVTSIGNHAFYNCSKLTQITIPNSVTSIGYSAFKDCTRLKGVTIPNSVTSIGTEAFSNTAYYNDSQNWENGVLYIGKHLIEAQTSISGSYSIKAGTLCISSEAFYNCTGLTSITIPESVTSIGQSAFSNCTGLTSITIPNGVTSIGQSAFYNCTGLKLITVNSPDIAKQLTSYAACGYLANYAQTVAIPATVTEIGLYVLNHFTFVNTITQNGKTVKLYSKHSHAESDTTWVKTENGYVCSECGIATDVYA